MPSNNPRKGSEMSSFEQPVEAFMASYVAAVGAKDIEAFVKLYAPEVRVFDAWSQQEYRGQDAWRAMVTHWFGSLGDEKVEVYFVEVFSTVGEELAFGAALARFTALDAHGTALRSLTNRFTVVLSKNGARWEVIHEHTSLPIDHETGTAIFAP
ncbi:nuclear transport factor 2 family protein [Arthrobacter sp. MYb227]|uniref:YybH family protein n=1 Tax=Arthrobacter sp. MYb227 TaxID=1848601 RepID=UPI0015E3114F|nr:nuclear transport factor 2 family protein [Arthrobacter sp. MYb227]